MFDRLVADGHILSTREVCREAEDSSLENLRDWAAQQHAVFHIPTAAEGTFVAGLYAVPHFQQNIEQKKLLKGGRNAAPFVIAKAATEGRCVEIGRASCGERVCQYVEHAGVADSLKKKKN